MSNITLSLSMNNRTLGLERFLASIPATKVAASGIFENGLWWVKISIAISHPLAWNVVQELGHVLNYLSTDERLPTVFMPVSPPPYMNGGPKDFLHWVVEAKTSDFTPDECQKWLEGRLPRPVDNISQWNITE